MVHGGNDTGTSGAFKNIQIKTDTGFAATGKSFLSPTNGGLKHDSSINKFETMKPLASIRESPSFVHKPKLSLNDMALAGKKNMGVENGISGYHIPLWKNALEKPTSIKISNSNTKSYIAQLMANKSLIPSPS